MTSANASCAGDKALDLDLAASVLTLAVASGNAAAFKLAYSNYLEVLRHAIFCTGMPLCVIFPKQWYSPDTHLPDDYG